MNPPLPKLPEEILQAALAREVEARDFYRDLAINCHVDFVRKLLERLQNEEAKHVSWVQEMLTRLHTGHDLV